MEVKQRYKNTELGKIPIDWDDKKFVNVLDGFSSGATPYRGRPEYYKGNIRWITSGELKYNMIYDTIEKISEKAMIDTNLKLWDKGTFLMAITGLEAEGTRGSCGIIGADSTTNQSCMALIPKDDLITIEYLFHYYVQFGEFLALKYCQGTKQQSYNASVVKRLPIILPPTKQEQAAIAQVLSDTDELISSLEKLIEKKKLIKLGTMQQLLTGKKRLPGFSGECIAHPLNDFLEYEQPTSYIVSDTEYDEENGIPVLTAGKTFILGYTQEEFGIFSNIPVIIFDDFTTAIKFVDFSFKVKSSAMKILKPKDENVNLRFIYEMMQRIVYPMGIGDHKRHWIANYQFLEIEVPEPKEQKAISDILSDLDSEIKSLEQKLNKYKSIKQGMMQNLLTGKIRLV